MLIVGVPKEIKTLEFRVGLVPASVQEVVALGSTVLVEKDAGLGIGISNEQYMEAGAKIVESAAEIYRQADLVVKVKEPQPEECRQLRAGQTLFTYLHLAPDPEQTKLLLESGVTAIAYETVTDRFGALPLLTPMSQVAGRMAVQAGARCLETAAGGSGVLLGGVPGVAPARVVIIGGGVVGSNAARIAVGMEADVTILDRSLERLRDLDIQFGAQIKTIYATKAMIEECAIGADLLIGAVLVPGAAAPKLMTRAMLSKMRPGSVLVDVSIDQGGCFETSRATTHKDPIYKVDNVLHYCVANMPGAVPRTSTFALNNVTLPFVLNLVHYGTKEALLRDPHLMNGLNVHNGQITCQAVADELGYDFIPVKDAIESF